MPEEKEVIGPAQSSPEYGPSEAEHQERQRQLPIRRIVLVGAALIAIIAVLFVLLYLLQPPTLHILGVTAALLAIGAIWLTVQAFRRGTIRARMLVAFMLLAFLPAAAVSAGWGIMGFRSGQSQAVEQLELAATFQETEINAWTDDLQAGLNTALNEADAILFARVLLKQEPTVAGANIQWDLEERLRRYIERTQQFEVLFLLDLEGNTVAATDKMLTAEFHGDETYFQVGLDSPRVSIHAPSSGQTVVVATEPVLDRDGQPLGILAGYAGVSVLNEITHEEIGIGERWKAYLVNSEHALVTGSRLRDVYTEGIDEVLETQTDGFSLYEDWLGEPVVGIYHWLPELRVALVVEQDQAAVFNAIYTTLGINVGVALISVVFAAAASLIITRSVVTPLDDLAHTAAQIAGGDLARLARVRRDDEIGKLGQAFNSMTVQLRDLIGSLEQRVADRTRDLEQRSAYLEASAMVGRAATSILDADHLIRQVVDLIRVRFGLYYVGLFLVDETGEWAVLRAGTGEGGQAMVARGHRIRIGEGMIGWSITHAQARIASEAESDAVRLTTPELPDTRSEAALPLRSRGRVIGALTVQSDQPVAFDQATVVVLQTMADQVAVALDNARLLAESRTALEMERRAYGELSRQAWIQLLTTRPDMSYRGDEHGVTSAGNVWRPEMETALQQGRIVQGDGADADDRLPLAVPIKVRGNVIGVLDTYKPADAGPWTSDEIALLETLADQLGVALESARLHLETERRAARERLTIEITDKMRRAASVDDIVQTAIDELFNALGTSRAFVRLGATRPAQDDENST